MGAGGGRLIRVRSHHVERKFCLWYEFVPEVDGERRVRTGEYCDRVPLEGLYGAFGFVWPFVVRGNTLVGDMGCSKMKLQSFGSLVVEDLEPDAVSEVGKPCVDVAIGNDEGSLRAGRE
jgi:hypothetical protein